MRGELSSSESEAYAVDIDQTEHRLVKFSLNFQFEMIVFKSEQFEMIVFKKWTDHVTHLFLDDHLFYMHSMHFNWIFFHGVV